MNDKDLKTNNEDRLLRMRYYQEIRNRGNFRETFINKPSSYWLNGNIFSVSPEVDKPKKAKSLVTILSIWNCMIGSGIVSLPYAVSRSGIIPYIILCTFFFLICYYTCHVICKTGVNDNDYSDTINKYLGPRFGYLGRVLQITFCICMNVGATYIYFLIMNQNLFPLIASFLNLIGFDLNINDLTPYFGQFSLMYCGIIVACLLFPFLMMKQVNFLIKVNSYGVYFVSVIIFYLIMRGLFALFNGSFDFQYKYNTWEDVTRHLFLFGENPNILLGILSSSYFSHSFILPIMKNNENPKNNKRDLFIGYFLVYITYILVGILGYIGFSENGFDPVFKKNWFQFLKQSDPLSYILRTLSVIQIFLVSPILAYCARIQLFGTFLGSAYPSRKHVLVFSISIILSSLLVLYYLYNSLDIVLSILGAGAGFVLIFLIPCSINIVYFRLKHPKQSLITLESSAEGINNKFTESQLGIIEEIGVSEKPYNKLKNLVFYATQILMILLGLFVLVSQFVNIEYYKIDIK